VKLYLTVEGVGDRAVQVGFDTTVGDLSEALGGNLDRNATQPGIGVLRTGSTLAPAALVVDCDLRSGDRVALVSADGPNAAAATAVAGPGSGWEATRSRTWRPAAMLKVLTGPAAPASIEIPFGETTIGRGEDSDVVVLDPGMSRIHASITIDDDSVEITDQGSLNGVVIDNEIRRTPTTMTRGMRALLGDTWIEIDHMGRSRGLGDQGESRIEFNRPPRLVSPYRPRKFELPIPPDPPPRQRIPKLSALAPLLMGAFMIYMPVLAGGSPNYMFGAFMLFSPVMLFGSFFESRSGARAAHRDAVAAFESAVTDIEHRLEEAHAAEQRGRLTAAPAPDDLEEIVTTLSPRLWERDINESDGLAVRIGLADQPSQNRIAVHDRGPADLRKRLEEIPGRFSEVQSVPAIASLRQHGGIGVSGPQEFTGPLCYSIVSQLAALHSPAELLIAAMIPEAARANWEWLKWLPHCPADDSEIGGHQLAADEADARALLARLLSFIDGRLGQRSGLVGDANLVAPAVVVVIGEGVPVEQHELTRLLETGPRAGVFVVWVSGASSRVPRTIGNVVTVDSQGGTAGLGFPGKNTTAASRPADNHTSDEAAANTIDDIAFETLDLGQAERLARLLAPIEDVAARFTSGSQIPSRVALVDLLGGPSIMDDAEPILEYWKRHPKTLDAPVGRLANEVFNLDIRRDGPHALVGGTSGAGKSEFLQSWVMSLAMTHSPEVVTFLLVDYKGGAAFADCSKLPHTVGMVTDLDTAGVRRALVSLLAELRRREELFAEHGCSDLLDMIDKKIPETPPSLLIIVDEFAALVHEVPEFVDGMVGVAQRGRSLGLHLVLATQRPAGIITGQVKSNTALRVSLRMTDVEDSTDVIDSPAAAEIDPSLPGRGIARIGRDRLAFQSAYVGGVSGVEDTGPDVELGAFDLTGVTPIKLDKPDLIADAGGPEETDLERLVGHIGRIHSSTGKPLPRKPWLEPLGSLYDLAHLVKSAAESAGGRSAGDGDRLPLGMVDVPDHQAQVPLHFDPDADGSLGIIGAGQSGKTVALRTICAAAGLSSLAGGPEAIDDIPHIYCLDYGGRGLRMVEGLPHVGGVVIDDDPERVRRVLTDLQVILDRRIEAFSQVKAANLGEYREACPQESTNRIYLLIDGYPAFHEMFEPVENERWIKLVRRFILEGRQVGIHVILTAPRREAIYSATVRVIGRWLILRQISVDDYRSLEVPVDILDDKAPPGRVIEDENVAQLAILGGEVSTERQADAMAKLADRLVEAGVEPAPPIRVLQPLVARAELPDPASIGVRDSDFGGYRPPDGFNVFLITGPRAAGKSTALASLGHAATAVGPEADAKPTTGPQDVVFLSPKPPTVKVDERWTVAVGQEQVEDAVYPLLSGVERPTLVLIDDAYPLFELGLPIDQLIEAADGTNLQVAAVLEDTRARSGYDPFARSLSAGKLGLLLTPSPLEDGEIFGLALPRVKSHLWPPGRGYAIAGQRIETVQIAT
jgi:S-DNA-T family DNA segregation ATPase FtsK/SpoIIIE